VPNPNKTDAGPDAGGAPFICYQSPVDGGPACVASCGGCTVTADCCQGETCIVSAGAASGVCGPCIDGGPPPPPPDSGTPPDGSTPLPDGSSPDAAPVEGGNPPPVDSGVPTCAQYGQLCSVSSDCCNGIPCTVGRCVTP
jgi:hypothetical protein